MASSGILVEDLSHLIAQATAPAFLLGAMAGLLSVLFARLNRIIDMSKAASADHDDDAARAHPKSVDYGIRVRLLGTAIECTVISGIFTAFLVIEGFAAAFLGADQAFGAAILFMLAMGFFVASLTCLLFEVRIAMRGHNTYI